MSSRSTARTDSWSCLIEQLRGKLQRVTTERDDARAELAAVRALHAHNLGQAGAWTTTDGAEEWESLHAGHEILPPDLAA